MTLTIIELRNLIQKTISMGGRILWIVAESELVANPLQLIPSNGLSRDEWANIMKNILVCRGFNQYQTQSILSHLPGKLISQKSYSICLFSGFTSYSKNLQKTRSANPLLAQATSIIKMNESPRLISFLLDPGLIKGLVSPKNMESFLSSILPPPTNSIENLTGEKNIMGKSTPTFRELLQVEKQSWTNYTHTLSREEKQRFERLFNKALFLAPAAGEMAGQKDPFILILMNIFMEMESRIELLEEKLENKTIENAQ